MKHPLAQGILGPRLSARRMIEVLSEHPVLSDSLNPPADPYADDDGPRLGHLGEFGLDSADDLPLEVSSDSDFLDLVLAAEILQMFTRDPVLRGENSYVIKHTIENVASDWLGTHQYISNGKVIWAAALIRLPLHAPLDGEGPNAHIGIQASEFHYVDAVVDSDPMLRAHHHRPPGFAYLRNALSHYVATGEAPSRWDGNDAEPEPKTSAFHVWLVAQGDTDQRDGAMTSRENFALDYADGVYHGHHRVAQSGEELVRIMQAISADSTSLAEAKQIAREWGS